MLNFTNESYEGPITQADGAGFSGIRTFNFDVAHCGMQDVFLVHARTWELEEVMRDDGTADFHMAIDKGYVMTSQVVNILAVNRLGEAGFLQE